MLWEPRAETCDSPWDPKRRCLEMESWWMNRRRQGKTMEQKWKIAWQRLDSQEVQFYCSWKCKPEGQWEEKWCHQPPFLRVKPRGTERWVRSPGKGKPPSPVSGESDTQWAALAPASPLCPGTHFFLTYLMGQNDALGLATHCGRGLWEMLFSTNLRKDSLNTGTQPGWAELSSWSPSPFILLSRQEWKWCVSLPGLAHKISHRSSSCALSCMARVTLEATCGRRGSHWPSESLSDCVEWWGPSLPFQTPRTQSPSTAT